MEKALHSSALVKSGTVEEKGEIFAQIDSRTVLIRCHAIPAAFTVAAARELVGRPFLRDHDLHEQLDGKRIGPVHIIACTRSVTENQAANLLGFPDATIVTTSFGVYVADNIQKIQLVLLANCRDETSTRQAVQRFFDWLERSGEAKYLAERAMARKNIIKAIAKEKG